MLTVEEARERLLAQAVAIDGVETLPTLQAQGRVLAGPLMSTVAVPPMDVSQMDGYALRAADAVSIGAVLPVSQRIAAGQIAVPLAAGSAARIFTGAPLPDGADAVVMQEVTHAAGEAALARRGDQRQVAGPGNGQKNDDGNNKSAVVSDAGE
jgi:molybdopterin molybdotransferase